MRWRGVSQWVAAAGLSAAIGQGALAAPPDPRDSAVQAAFGAKVRVVRDTFSGAPRALFGLSEPTRGASPAERARGFIEASRRLLALGDTVLVASETRSHAHGHVVRFTQTALGVPVEGRMLTVKLDAAGRVTGVTSDLVPFELARPASRIGAEAARAAVLSRFEVAAAGAPTEVVLVSAPGLARLAWRVPAAVIPLAAHFFVWIDAESGEVLREAPAALDQAMTHLPRKSEAPR